MAADGINRLLSPAEIARLGSLRLGSRFTVEGRSLGAPQPAEGVSVKLLIIVSTFPAMTPSILTGAFMAATSVCICVNTRKRPVCGCIFWLTALVPWPMPAVDQQVSLRLHLRRGSCLHHDSSPGHSRLALFDRKCKLVMPPRSAAEHCACCAIS